MLLVRKYATDPLHKGKREKAAYEPDMAVVMNSIHRSPFTKVIEISFAWLESEEGIWRRWVFMRFNNAVLLHLRGETRTKNGPLIPVF